MIKYFETGDINMENLVIKLEENKIDRKQFKEKLENICKSKKNYKGEPYEKNNPINHSFNVTTDFWSGD